MVAEMLGVDQDSIPDYRASTSRRLTRAFHYHVEVRAAARASARLSLVNSWAHDNSRTAARTTRRRQHHPRPETFGLPLGTTASVIDALGVSLSEAMTITGQTQYLRFQFCP
jgi:hypothetical protein